MGGLRDCDRIMSITDFVKGTEHRLHILSLL
jgi:hypothetical protein